MDKQQRCRSVYASMQSDQGLLFVNTSAVFIGSIRRQWLIWFFTIYIWCTAWQKGPYAICGQHSSRSACASVQSNLGIFCLSIYTNLFTDSVYGKRRPRLIRACIVPNLQKGPFHALCIIWHKGPFFMCHFILCNMSCCLVFIPNIW